MFNGLVQVNIELTSRCNKSCWFCGRREREKMYGDQNYGDIDFETLRIISNQLPIGTIIALHNNGEALLYPRLGEAISLFKNRGFHVYTVSNGKLLMERYGEIVNNLDQISISVIENDTPEEKELQYNILKRFVETKKDKSPFTVLRFVGNIKDEEQYIKLGLPIVRRTIHLPKGSIGYRNEPMKPEFLVCWDLMSRLAINRFGDISLCVRFDPDGDLVLGNVKTSSLRAVWSHPKRLNIINNMIAGKRIGFCGTKCQFWGIPTGN